MACLINLLNNGVDGVYGVDGVNGVFDNLPKKSLPSAGLEPAFLGLLVQALTQYTNVHLVGRRSNPYTYKL